MVSITMVRQFLNEGFLCKISILSYDKRNDNAHYKRCSLLTILNQKCAKFK